MKIFGFNIISVPVLLILIGIGYLLANLNIIPLTPWQAFIRYWPAILVIYGLNGLIKCFSNIKHQPFSSKKVNLWYYLAFSIIGIVLLAPRIGLEFSINWNMIWPVLLIFLGLYLLLKDNKKFKKIVASKPVTKSVTFVGEYYRAGEAWSLDDMRQHFGIGDITLDITKAIIPDKEVFVQISGILGDATVYVPSDLPVKVNTNIKLGSITLFGQSDSGSNCSMYYESPDYERASRKLNLVLEWTVGEINVRKVG